MRNKIQDIYEMVLLVIGFACGFTLASCSMFEKPLSDQTKACAAVCGALDAARCWDEPGIGDVIGAAGSIGDCLDRCMSGDVITTSVNVQCLAESDKCDLANCVAVE